jgi:DMSO/TMAO reductase YedYZ molybdopterin-dependent catalytic subunit
MKKRSILAISLMFSILLAFLLISGCASDTTGQEAPESGISENTEDTKLNLKSELPKNVSDTAEKEDPESNLSEKEADTTSEEDLKSELPENLNYTIDISGGTKGNTTLTYSDLKAMDFVKRSNVTYYYSTGNKTVSDFIGIEWNKILEKGEDPTAEVYFKVYSPDGYNVVYTRDQANDTILAFIEDGKALTADFKDNPVHLVYVDGMQCHWVTLPVKIEVSSINPDESIETGMNETNGENSSA